ncbi:MAG: hypothetical protein QN172_05385 [Armatimonadota bacterium]|nr:hypothetical protein [Armatimonadota bacterium]MDR7562946.1 hypothetical protein [Armatimonadota bacterium]MDR7568269.1 hypothetical protein [Armatimonadota bacterium]MDR7601874.1 hypothetical protein [Armatimonadota bacterium]
MAVLVDPTGGIQGITRRMAPRGGRALRGARVGLVDNGKRNADVFLRALGTLLRERYGVGEVVLRRKPHFAVPVSPELVEELSAQCDFVIPGVGD